MTEPRNGATNRRCQSIREVNKISLVGGTHPEVGCFHPRRFLDIFYLRQKSECCCRFQSRVTVGRLVALARAPSVAQCGIHETDLKADLQRSSCREQRCRTEQTDQNGTSVWLEMATQCLDWNPSHSFELCSQICRCNMPRGGPARVPLRPSTTNAHSILCAGC